MEASNEFSKLNQQQQDMLRLFKNPLPGQDYLEIKRFIVQMLAKKLMEKWNA